MNAGQSLIAELEEAIQRGSSEQRVETLRRITDLFLVDADRLTTKQIEVFDDVLEHLIQRIEGKALAELSGRLGPIKNAPMAVVQRLARNDDIAVAEPVLRHSPRLGTKDLIEIANTKSCDHLLAVSGRAQLDVLVTDVLIGRRDRRVMHRLAANQGAHFSETGFTNLIKHSDRDGQLAEKLVLRGDVPLQLFHQLLLRATDTVRARLLASASPERREHIQRVLATISEQVGADADMHRELDYARSRRLVLSICDKGELNEAALIELVRAKRHPEIVVALSVLCSAPLELIANLLHSEHRESFLVPCKAAGLTWSTVCLLVNQGVFGRAMSEQDVAQAEVDYSRLSRSGAQRVLRFWQVRQTVSPNNIAASAARPPALDQ